MPISYSNACNSILSDPAPVLYLDTCMFLDIIRAPVRETIPSNSAQCASELILRSKKTPRAIWLITSETVQMEWNDNNANVMEEVKREIRKLEARRKHFLAAAAATTNSNYQHGQSESSLNLVSQLETAAKTLLNECMVVQPDAIHMAGAMKRVKQNLAPAKKGKAEAKDCEIYELFFSLCQHLRENGFSHPCVFSSSNKKEYGPENSDGVQPELDSVRGKFVGNFPWAIAAIDNRS